jgi:hypothetical protein
VIGINILVVKGVNKMKISEVIKEAKSRKPSVEVPEIELIQFREDDDIDPELRELCDNLVGLTSSTQARAILSVYFPELDWGGRKV